MRKAKGKAKSGKAKSVEDGQPLRKMAKQAPTAKRPPAKPNKKSPVGKKRRSGGGPAPSCLGTDCLAVDEIHEGRRLLEDKKLFVRLCWLEQLAANASAEAIVNEILRRCLLQPESEIDAVERRYMVKYVQHFKDVVYPQHRENR